MQRYKIECMSTNSAHTVFRMFDGKGANVGTLTIQTDDLRNFLREWNGMVYWHGLAPKSLTEVGNE